MHECGLKPLTTALCLLLYSASFSSGRPRPQSLGAAKPSQTADYAKESSVIESQRTTVTFAADGTATREDTAGIRVQSEGGIEEWGLLSFAFNSANQVVEISYVRVVKRDGSMVTTPLTDMQDVTAEVTSEAPMYSDYREKHVPVKGLGAGDHAVRHGQDRRDSGHHQPRLSCRLRATGARAADLGFDGDSEDAGLSLCRITSN